MDETEADRQVGSHARALSNGTCHSRPIPCVGRLVYVQVRLGLQSPEETEGQQITPMEKKRLEMVCRMIPILLFLVDLTNPDNLPRQPTPNVLLVV